MEVSNTNFPRDFSNNSHQYLYIPDRNNDFSTDSSCSNLMWAKFFLLILMLQMAPQFSNISRKISSFIFSGRPPTNIVLHPGGRSLVVGGGASTIYTCFHKIANT